MNIAPRIGEKLDQMRMTLKARRGGFRENQLVVGKRHVFDGGMSRVTRLWSVSQGKLLPELVVTKTRGSDGRYRTTLALYSGNIRRVGQQLADEIGARMSDPVFKAAVTGDKVALALWNKRVEAAEARERAQPPPPLKPFVNAQGKTIFVKDLREARLSPAP